MNTDTEMARLERVDLRSIWQSEPGDFTPWLARDANIKLLGDTIGIELEVEAQEKDVGRFQADILCKDTAKTDHWVLIENQLERTDHTHLGQLLTYAAGLDAVTIVWIAASFTDEHRAALDWLNEKISEKIQFFGIEIELWRIAESPTAPKFSIVSKPNDWTKPGGGVRNRFSPSGLSDIRKMQLEYWEDLSALLKKANGRVRPTKPLPQHWQTFSIGRSNFLLYSTINVRNARIGVQLILQGEHAKAHFSLLHGQKEAIESEAGEQLEWRLLPDNKESQINLYRHDTDPSNRDSWEEQHRWLLEKLDLFHSIFSDRIKSLDASEAAATDCTPAVAG